MKRNFFGLLLLATATLFAFFSCKNDGDSNAKTYFGEQTPFGLGISRVYFNTDDLGIPEEIGVILSKSAYDAILAQGDFSASLNLPVEASTQTTFKHVYFNWNQHGHEPMPIYTLPHFDIHFYTTSEAERMAIAPSDTLKGANLPSGDLFPPTYIPTGLVPQMGVHWLDVFSGELNGDTFDETFLYGSFDGKLTFYEPMITKAFIDSQNGTFEKAILQPAKFPEAGKYYPTRFGFKLDAAAGEYRFYLSGFVKH